MTETLCFEGINNFVIYVQPVYIIITSVIYIPHSSPSTYSKCKSPNNEVSSSPNSLNLQETSFNRQVGKISVAPQTILKQYRSQTQSIVSPSCSLSTNCMHNELLGSAEILPLNFG